MEALKNIDIKGFIETATKDVFDTMLSMSVNETDGDSESLKNINRIVGTVSFAGEVMGNVSVHVSIDFAKTITAAMLGMEEEEVEDDEEIHDVIGELCNMIGGDLKSRFCDAGLSCQLSIPSTTSGSDFKIEAIGSSMFEKFAFNNQADIGVVEVSLKQGN